MENFGLKKGDLKRVENGVAVFEDIDKLPNHLLSIPTEHLGTINDLTSQNIEMVKELEKQSLSVLRDRLGDVPIDESELIIGYHKPPFNSQPHLHLHILYPRSELNWWNRLVRFRSDTFWYMTQQQLINQITNI